MLLSVVYVDIFMGFLLADIVVGIAVDIDIYYDNLLLFSISIFY